MPDFRKPLFGGNSDPSDAAAAVVPNDGADLAFLTRRIYVGGAGNIVATVGGADVTFTGCPVGLVLEVVASRIKATGTTATNLVALF